MPNGEDCGMITQLGCWNQKITMWKEFARTLNDSQTDAYRLLASIDSRLGDPTNPIYNGFQLVR